MINFQSIKQWLVGQYLTHMLLFQIGGVFLFLTITIGGVMLYSYKSDSDDLAQSMTTAEDTPKVTFRDSDFRKDAVRSLVEAVYMAHGGRARIEQLRSIARYGVLSYGEGKTTEVAYLWKRPNKVSYRLNLTRYSIKKVFNGTDTFQYVQTSGRPINLQELTEEDKLFTKANSTMVLPFFPYLNDFGYLKRLDDEEANGQPAYVLEWSKLGEASHKFYISKSNYRVIKRHRSSDPASPSDQRDLYAIFDNFTTVEGLVLPQKETVYIAGAFANEFTVEEIQVNSGILDSYFDPPEPGSVEE